MSSRIRVLRPEETHESAVDACCPSALPNSQEERTPFSIYRQHTIALLRRYFRLSIEVGRLPSLLGREFFRANVTSCRMQSFEDAVIFVYDIERCLQKLDHESRQLIARIVLQEYTQEEAARLLGWRLRRVERRYGPTLDRLAETFVRLKLLPAFPPSPPKPAEQATEVPDEEMEALPARKPMAVESCQDVENSKIEVSRS